VSTNCVNDSLVACHPNVTCERVPRMLGGSVVFRRKATLNQSLSSKSKHVQSGRRKIPTALWLMPLALMVGCSQCGRATKANDTQAAVVASSNPAPSANPIAGPIGEILAHNSAECPACANRNCRKYIDKCMQIEGNATAGSAKGKPKSELCIETLDCSIKARCLQEFASAFCYCGSTNGEACILGHQQNGSCKAKIEAGFETTDSKDITVGWHNETKGAGAAMLLADCLAQSKCTRCF